MDGVLNMTTFNDDDGWMRWAVMIVLTKNYKRTQLVCE